MQHYQLERKFRNLFDEEKYVYLVKKELNRILKHIDFLLGRTTESSYSMGHTLSVMSKDLIESGDRLYNFYKENNLSEEYHKLLDWITIWLGYEKIGRGVGFNELKALEEQVKEFQKFLENVKQGE